MHINFVSLAEGVGSAYMAVHLFCSAVGPKLPTPDAVKSQWYPALYAAVNWFAWGNGPKDANNAPTGNSQLNK